MGRFTFDDLSDNKKVRFLRWLITGPSDSFRDTVIERHYGSDLKSLDMLKKECMEMIKDEEKMGRLIEGIDISREEASIRLQNMANACDLLLLIQEGAENEQKAQVVNDFLTVTKESFPPLNCKLAYDDVKDCYVINFEGPNASQQRDVFIKHFLKGSYGSGLIDDDDEIEIKHNKEGKFQLVIDSHDFPAVLARMTKVIENANIADPFQEADRIYSKEFSKSDRLFALHKHIIDVKNKLPEINKELELTPSFAQKVFQELTSLWNKIADLINFKDLNRKNAGSEFNLSSDDVPPSSTPRV